MLYSLSTDKPDPPISVALITCGETEAEISWTKGASNNAPIQYFIIQYNTSFSPDEWFMGASNVLATQNSGEVKLTPWVEYNFRVLATNKIGISEPSYHTETVCKTNAARPSKNPENVRTIGDKRNYLIIEWTVSCIISGNACTSNCNLYHTVLHTYIHLYKYQVSFSFVSTIVFYIYLVNKMLL